MLQGQDSRFFAIDFSISAQHLLLDDKYWLHLQVSYPLSLFMQGWQVIRRSASVLVESS
jgi:hypothetical protein